MKLFVKYNLVNVATTIIVLLLSGVVYYFSIEHVLVHQLDKSLVEEEKEITDYVNENNLLPEASYTKDEQEFYSSINNDERVARNFSSVNVPKENKHGEKLYRQLEFPVTVKGKMYKAYVRKSQEETDDIVRLILKITLAIVLLLLVILFIINRFMLNKLWRPFNSTLEQMKKFNVSGSNEIYLQLTNINEFKELNGTVYTLTEKASRDYNEIKSFTENASHEIQTPLAIIASKVELLSQSETLKEKEMNAIQSIAETTNRLAKLNQSLLLLAKIDNKQFNKAEQINISAMLLHHVNNYEELFHAKEIIVVKNIVANVVVTMNETLAETLIINLLTNAIKHNTHKGFINIELTEKHLLISNSGKVLNVNPVVYFERFKKESASHDSMGLGLSIVKKICETYNFEIDYNYSDQLHSIRVNL
jgi:signal transduction histidine kinase